MAIAWKIPTEDYLMTRAIRDRAEGDTQFAEFCCRSLQRHLNGDWGDMGEYDKKKNNMAVENLGSIYSTYVYDKYTTIWIITEADRSATTILFPDDY